MADQSPLDRDGWYRVDVTPDYMEAYLMLEPPIGNGNWPGKEKAREAMRAEGIIYGIDDKAIDEAIVKRTVKTLIAKGLSPVPGKDAEINFLFETGAFRKALLEDKNGKVDYHQLQTVQNVKVGDAIAVKIPATSGEDGIDIRGRKLMATPGKDKLVKLGKNVEWSPDNLSVIATIGGEPSFANNKLGVYAMHEVKGDVNFESGNILFSGSVTIRGNVESGFKVEADGDVTIYGNVDASDIMVGGNLLVQGGITGMDKTQITVGGDFSAKYIERAKVDVGGSLTVREAIMYCQVNADQKITVEGGKGLIVGGMIRAGLEISAKTIGSRLGTVTELEVGVRPQIKEEVVELEKLIKQHTDSLDKAEKAIVLLSNSPNLPPDRQVMLQNLIKTSYALKEQITANEAAHQKLLEEFIDKSKERGRIKVSDTIYPGVRVSIGKTTIMVPDELKFIVIFYNAGEIQMQSYR